MRCGLLHDAARWQRIDELYHAACARPPEARAAFLAEACSDDEAVRREIEALLNEPGSVERRRELTGMA